MQEDLPRPRMWVQEWEERYHDVIEKLWKMQKAPDDMLTGSANTGETDKGDNKCEESSSSIWSKKKKKWSQ